jgi:hypothetical protein
MVLVRVLQSIHVRRGRRSLAMTRREQWGLAGGLMTLHTLHSEEVGVLGHRGAH